MLPNLLPWIRKNRSDSWKRRVGTNLIINIDEASLCGVPIGGRIDDLSHLGPSDYFSRGARSSLVYSRKGLNLICSGDRLTSIFAAISRRDNLRPFPGRWTFGLREIAISHATKQAEILGLMGAASESWNDGQEIALLFQKGDRDYQFLWDSSGRLLYIVVEESVGRLC